MRKSSLPKVTQLVQEKMFVMICNKMMFCPESWPLKRVHTVLYFSLRIWLSFKNWIGV